MSDQIHYNLQWPSILSLLFHQMNTLLLSKTDTVIKFTKLPENIKIRIFIYVKLKVNNRNNLTLI